MRGDTSTQAVWCVWIIGGLNFSYKGNQFAPKIRSMGEKYASGYKTKSQWLYLLYLIRRGKLIGATSFFFVEVPEPPKMDAGRRRARL